MAAFSRAPRPGADPPDVIPHYPDRACPDCNALVRLDGAVLEDISVIEHRAGYSILTPLRLGHRPLSMARRPFGDAYQGAVARVAS